MANLNSKRHVRYPDFYRLRIGAKTIDFAVDSCRNNHSKADVKALPVVINSKDRKQVTIFSNFVNLFPDIQRKVNGITPENERGWTQRQSGRNNCRYRKA